MGDISSLEQDESGRYLAALLELGDLEQIKQLTVDPDLINNLANIWTRVKDSLEQERLRDVAPVVQQLLVYTAYTVLDVKYLTKIEVQVKENLVIAINGIEKYLADFPNLAKICSSLGLICYEPWAYVAFREFGGASELTTQLIDAVWDSEGVIFFETRLELLTRKKLQQPAIIAKILRVLLSKGGDWFHACESDEVNSNLDPYYFNFGRYLEYLEIYILLWSKSREDFEDKILKDVNPKLISRVICMLKEKSSSQTNGRLLSKLWKGNTIDILTPLLLLVVPAALDRICNVEEIKSLFRIWLEICVEGTDDDDNKIKVLQTLLVNGEMIKLSDYIYGLSEVILEKFYQNELTRRRLYVHTYLRAMMIDLNLIENLRAETPQDPVKLQKEYLRLSLRYINLANYFQEFKFIWKELMLTAFSLNPAQQLFNELFPEDVRISPQSTNDVDSSLTVHIPPANPLSVAEALHSESYSTEQLQLPENLVDDLKDITEQPRWGALLGHFTKEELKKLCTQLLNAGSDFLVKEKKLDYVDVDYEKYSHLPSKYDPNDDGIEKNYFRPNECFKFAANNGRGRGRGNFKIAKRLIKNANRSRNHQHGSKKPLGDIRKQRKIQSANDAGDQLFFSNLTTGSSRKPGRPSSSTDTTDQLDIIKQFFNFNNNNRPDFEKPSSNWQRLKKRNIKSQYEKKFLDPQLPFPGSYNWIPDSKPTSGPTKTTKAGRKHRLRKCPTRYIGLRSPYRNIQNMAWQSLEFEFRREKSKLSQEFMGNDNSFPVADSVLEDFFPETSENQWLEVENARSVQISSSLKLQSKATETCSSLNMCPKVLIDLNYLHVPDELVQLTSEYLSQKAKVSQLGKRKLEEDESQRIISSPLVIQEIHKFKKCWYNNPSTAFRPSRYRNKRRKNININLKITDEKENEKRGMQVDLPKEDIALSPPPPSPTVLEQEDILQFEFGICYEVRTLSKVIHPSGGPKTNRENAQRNMMITDALTRIKNNLEWKSYTWKEVLDNARKDAKKLETEGSPQDWQPQVTAVSGEELSTEQISMARYRATKVISSKPNMFNVPPAHTEFTVPLSEPSSNNSKRKTKDSSDLRYDSGRRQPYQSSDYSDAEDTSTSSSSCYSNKRKYHYYPDDVIHRAIIAMMQGKTMKQAAEMNGINRSALCKRLHVMNLRKDGKLVIPPNMLEVMNVDATGKKGRQSDKKGRPRLFTDEELNKAIGCVMFGHMTLKQACVGTKVSAARLGFFLNNIKSHGEEARVELEKGHKNDKNSHVHLKSLDDVMAEAGQPPTSIVSTILAEDDEKLMKALALLAGDRKVTLERASAVYGVGVGELASVVDVYYARQANNQKTLQPKPYPSRRKKCIPRQSKCLDSQPPASPTNGESTVLSSSQSENQTVSSSASAVVATPCSADPVSSPAAPLILIPSAEAQIGETEPPKEKSNYTISFPILRNPYLQAASAQVAGKPSLLPSSKVPTKEILDEHSGSLIIVPDVGDTTSKAEEIFSDLSPVCDEPEADFADVESDSPDIHDAYFADLDEGVVADVEETVVAKAEEEQKTVVIANVQEEPVVGNAQDGGFVEKETRLQYHSIPGDATPQMVIKVLAGRSCQVHLERDEIDKYRAKHPIRPATSSSSPDSYVSSPEMNNSSFAPEIKRSERINSKPKVDFKSGAPMKIPNGNCPPSKKKNKQLAKNMKRSSEDLTEQNGTKKRKLDKENEKLLHDASKSKYSSVLSPHSSSSISSEASGGNKNKPKMSSVSRKRTRNRVKEETTSDSDSCSDIDDDPDYSPDELEEDEQERIRSKRISGESSEQSLYPLESLQPVGNKIKIVKTKMSMWIPPTSNCHTSHNPYNNVSDCNVEQAEEFIQPIVSKNIKRTTSTPTSNNNKNALATNQALVRLSNKDQPQYSKPRPLSKKMPKDPLSEPELIDIVSDSDDESKKPTINTERVCFGAPSSYLTTNEDDVSTEENKDSTQLRSVSEYDGGDESSEQYVDTILPLLPEDSLSPPPILPTLSFNDDSNDAGINGEAGGLDSVDIQSLLQFAPQHTNTPSQPCIEVGGPMALNVNVMENGVNSSLASLQETPPQPLPTPIYTSIEDELGEIASPQFEPQADTEIDESMTVPLTMGEDAPEFAVESEKNVPQQLRPSSATDVSVISSFSSSTSTSDESFNTFEEDFETSNTCDDSDEESQQVHQHDQGEEQKLYNRVVSPITILNEPDIPPQDDPHCSTLTDEKIRAESTTGTLNEPDLYKPRCSTSIHETIEQKEEPTAEPVHLPVTSPHIPDDEEEQNDSFTSRCFTSRLFHETELSDVGYTEAIEDEMIQLFNSPTRDDNETNSKSNMSLEQNRQEENSDSLCIPYVQSPIIPPVVSVPPSNTSPPLYLDVIRALPKSPEEMCSNDESKNCNPPTDLNNDDIEAELCNMFAEPEAEPSPRNQTTDSEMPELFENDNFSPDPSAIIPERPSSADRLPPELEPMLNVTVGDSQLLSMLDDSDVEPPLPKLTKFE